MSRPVRVKSIDAVEELAAAVRTFQEQAASALTDLRLEVNRASDWIHNDRRAYWGDQLRRCWDRAGQAKIELEQARTFRRIAEHQPACREEKKALDVARRRLRTAEEKVEAVRHWTRLVDRAIIDYRGSMGPLARWLEIDLPQALAALERIRRTLESYIALEAPAEEVGQRGASPPIEDPGGNAAAEVPEPPPEAPTGDGPEPAGPDRETPP